ncbi:8-oxoguanine DNA glycosylase OGG fold protein [Kitasatospora purpeofusca]|uniref:8-oxoguanine DNA glycosylase OGG fold protein n=1 Tax=Kitasatospora purpeofusca TaxID=67352 RepID=UPI003659FAC0
MEGSVKALPDDFPVPGLDAVLSQAIPFDKDRWIPLLPDATWWPAELDDCPRVGRWPRVDRRTVFSVACRAATAETNRHLLVAALVWGTGTKAREVRRRGRIFAHTSAAELDARLGAALTALREKGAAEAYWAFNNDHRIPHLGPAFFTKVLYFAGDEAVSGPHRPLILDSVAVTVLKELGIVDERWPVSGWKTNQYRQYLVAAHNLARQRAVRPDQIEAALFRRGKQAS